MARQNLNRRAAKAAVRQRNALTLFQSAAVELEAAAEEHRVVADEADRVVNAHLAVKYDAEERAQAAAKSAEKIRELVG